MGREIRHVPADWEHPRYTAEDALCRERIGEFRPLYDKDYETAAEEWVAEFDLWRAGKHPSQPCDYCRYYWEYAGVPDPDSHRDRKWTAEEATHFQVYETVSEGTPVTPAFATKQDLINYLVTRGDFWDQARGDGGWRRDAAARFVENEWAPSLMVSQSASGVEIAAPRDGGLD